MQWCAPFPGHLHQPTHAEHCTACALAWAEAVLAVKQLVAEVLPDALMQDSAHVSALECQQGACSSLNV
jgi:hypothetical protein